MSNPIEIFSMVIAGSMNPRIHHPTWYEAVKILSSDEARTAVGVPLMCTPLLAQFQVPGIFSLQFIEQRWEIHGTDPQKMDRIVEISGRVFDTLYHTPVNAFGLNFVFVRSTGLQNAGARLAELVNSLPLGRKTTETDSASITTTAALPEKVISETVSGVPEMANCIRLIYNVHHPIKSEGLFFALGPLLRAAFEEDYPECKSRAEQISEALAARSNNAR
jgi:hypothetical protein